jgi:hypothetical protein
MAQPVLADKIVDASELALVGGDQRRSLLGGATSKLRRDDDAGTGPCVADLANPLRDAAPRVADQVETMLVPSR